MTSLPKILMAAAGSNAGALYIEDLFSTYLYTGNGSTQSIVNGIDLSGKGGLVWVKGRAGGANGGVLSHYLFDSARTSVQYFLRTDGTLAENNGGTSYLSSFNSDGFSLGSATPVNDGTGSNATYASWTFRKSPRFFDVVTYTGTGSARTVSHSLGQTPGMIVVKAISAAGYGWAVWHKSIGDGNFLRLDLTNAANAAASYWNNTAPTETEFTVGTGSLTNDSGVTYVAYLFAHDTEPDGVIQCGSYTGNGSTTGPTVDLGWEPQWLLVKISSGATGVWYIVDNARGLPVGGDDAYLVADQALSESSGARVNISPTGFQIVTTDSGWNTSSYTYIYVAIRRGPMRAPTSASEVFKAVGYTGDGTTNRNISCGFPPDLTFGRGARNAVSNIYPQDRLRGLNYLNTQSTAAEGSPAFPYSSFFMDGFVTSNYNTSSTDYIAYAFRRAPEFMDVVCYTGTGSARTVDHNLGVAPELIIVKQRNGTWDWFVVSNDTGYTGYLTLNANYQFFTSSAVWNNTPPTDSVFTLGSSGATNGSADTYVAYLFATLAGVSKVGSYTGTGADLNVDCGFSAGAAFVLIKRTDSTGDWYVWDSTRGIVAGNDPYLLLNSTAAEVTGTDYIDPLSSGFTVTSAAPAALNASGGTYIYLAIAA